MTSRLPFQQTELGCQIVGTERWEVRAGSLSAGLQVTRSRRTPWLREARVIRFGRGLDRGEVAELVRALSETAVERPVLRLCIEALSERKDDLEAVAEACQASGFSRAPERRSYSRTVWIDLGPSEEDLLAGFHKTGRQNIRAPGKKGFEVRRLVDPDAAHRVRELSSQSFQRTGAVAPSVAWEELIEVAAAPETPVCLAGLFREDDATSKKPLSFAVAFLHGDVAEYSHAGSVRDPEIRVPLLYSVTWELMKWAKSRGATAWDFGGVTGTEAHDADDRRGGISDFKRYFSTRVLDVGEEWVLEPRRGFAHLFRTLLGRGAAARDPGGLRSSPPAL